jgi:epoxyqueuosine reductase
MESVLRQDHAASFDGALLWQRMLAWAKEAGLSQIGVAAIDLSTAEPGLAAWLDAGFHGSMRYMARHGQKRARPAALVPGTVSVITARVDYRSASSGDDWQAIEWQRLARPEAATVSLYARGRDYHKVLRSRLQTLADRIARDVGPFGHRVFTDSAPVLEVELAARSGLGWRGKHTLALSRDAGSTFFLGEIFVDLALPATPAAAPHCGSCSACIDVCPTRAIVAPYRLDARRCISYLTIEHEGPIALELRPLIGNRIYGCDDCQLACPWNKYAQRSALPDFEPRHGLERATLLELWGWTEPQFLARTEGSALRRIGWRRWRRNLAVALGNALRASADAATTAALRHARADERDAMVAEHIDWALAQASRGDRLASR